MSNVSKFSARSGRMMREDGSVINAADVLDMIAKGQLKVQLDGDSIVIDNVDIGADLGIKDGENKLKVNADGSIDTKITGSIVAEAKKPYVGYSTDDKSIIAPDAERGDEFIELDTKEVYFHDGTQWVVF